VVKGARSIFYQQKKKKSTIMFPGFFKEKIKIYTHGYRLWQSKKKDVKFPVSPSTAVLKSEDEKLSVK